MGSSYFDFNNSFPRTVNLGVLDKSKGELTYEDVPLTWHIPLIYIFSEKGRTVKTKGGAAAIQMIFGEQFMNKRSPYYMHPSKLYNLLQDTTENGGGGATVCVKRLIPDDAKVKANFRLWLDVIKGKVPNYKRNSDGSFALNDGKKELDDTTPWIDGYFTRWSVGYDTDENLKALSAKTSTDGTIALWKVDQDAIDAGTEKHLTKDETTVDDATNGHTGEANNTIYVYDTKEDMYMPVWGKTKRTKCVIDAGGNRTSNDEETFGTTADTWVKSKSYPIFEAVAAEVGSGYDNYGFIIEPFDNAQLDPRQLANSLSLPYKFTYITRPNKNKSGVVVETLDYNRYVKATLKKDDYDENLDATLDLGEQVPHAWFNETNTSKAIRFYDVGAFNVYRNNVEEVLKMLLETEKPHLTTEATSWEDTYESDTMSWTDFINSDEIKLDDQFGLINILNFRYSKGASMFSAVPATMRTPDDAKTKELDMNITQELYLTGGQDGTMTLANFEELVVRDIAKYGNIDDKDYQNLGTNPETIIWDSGFTMETKEKITPFIAVRKGTSFVASTHVDGEEPEFFDFSLHFNRLDKLRKAMTLYPESDQYGTPTCRAAIWVGYGKIGDSQKLYPLTLELACKINRMIGPQNGKWDDTRVISDPLNKKFKIMHSIEPKNLSYSQQDKLNTAGANYPLTGSEHIPFIAAFKTVYNDATSGLYSFITTQGCTVLDRVQYKVWERFVGYAGTDSNALLLKRIQEYANLLLNGVTGTSLNVSAVAEMTEADVKRGFSYQLVGKIYSSTMKTLQIYHTETYRVENSESK